jgi:heterodisulfide reductase subunit C
MAGTFWRMGRWCFVNLGPEAAEHSPHQRLKKMPGAICSVVLSRHGWTLGKSLLLDVALQRQIARKSLLRWIMHMGLFYGVLLLIVMHALDDLILTGWIDEYASTLNPFMFLRNLLGLLVLAGLLIAMVRRRRLKVLKRFSNTRDCLLLVLLATIVLSGVTLEATQIISESLFDEMVMDYWGSQDPDEIAPLKAFWAEQYHVVFSSPVAKDAAALDSGRQLHIDYCRDCHARPRSAFMAFAVAKAIKPAGAWLNGKEISQWLWYFHYLTSCLALAYLPFGKLFHLFSVPISLAVRSVSEAAGNRAENRPVRRALGLDACTHCGVCSQHCSVAPIFQVIDNPTILPSEKIDEIGRLGGDRYPGRRHWRLAQGSGICTTCGRCTELCPSGIDLHDMWLASQADLAQRGCLPPHGWIRHRTVMQWADQARENGMAKALIDTDPVGPRFTENPDTFRACVQCTTCTTVCPVVAASGDPRRDLDMTPQQVMNLMRLELKEMALGCRMVWDCVTCYKCQEHCPQGVPVADVLYELRNEACRRLAPTSILPPKPPTQAKAGAGQKGRDSIDEIREMRFTDKTGINRLFQR